MKPKHADLPAPEGMTVTYKAATPRDGVERAHRHGPKVVQPRPMGQRGSLRRRRRARARVEPGMVHARIGPYNASLVRVEATAIRKVHVVEIKDGEGEARYSLAADLQSGARVQILGPLLNPYPAHYVERAIEDYIFVDDEVRPRAPERGAP